MGFDSVVLLGILIWSLLGMSFFCFVMAHLCEQDFKSIRSKAKIAVFICACGPITIVVSCAVGIFNLVCTLFNPKKIAEWIGR